MTTVLLFIATILFLFLTWFFIFSIKENERLAIKKSLILLIIVPILVILPVLVTFPGSGVLGWFMLFLTGTGILLLLLPIKGKVGKEKKYSDYRIDERDTMFSRRELAFYPERKEEYYRNFPEKLELDEKWRNKPGLMSSQSTLYSPFIFLAAEASFFTIEQLRNEVDGEVNKLKTGIKTLHISSFIKKWSRKLGAQNTGICKTESYHFYSFRGRGNNYGNKVEPKHKYAIAFTVAMNKAFTVTGPAGPTLMESAQQYLNSGIIAIQVAKYIRNLGYKARAHIDGNYEVICPLVARDAGLGEIGRMGLLMTPQLGPRVRISVVTTDLPLIPDQRNFNGTVHDFCSICTKCADICPGQAIPTTGKEEIHGFKRWQINQEKCYSYWCTVGTDCGRCISVCPYSHPNNLLHNLVRKGIQNSWLFRRFALFMDNFFYGKNPKPAKVSQWMDTPTKSPIFNQRSE